MTVSVEALMAAVTPAVSDAGMSLPRGTVMFRESQDGDGQFGRLSNDRGDVAEMRLSADVHISRAVVDMALVVQQVVARTLDEVGRSRRWPSCPSHSGEHALRPAVADDVATWLCPESGDVVARIGGLVEPAQAERFLAAQDAAKMAWFARYEGLGLEEARHLAEQEARPVRIIGPGGGRRTSLVFARLNLLLGPDGELVGMEPG
jgi:hypothetical protein